MNKGKTRENRDNQIHRENIQNEKGEIEFDWEWKRQTQLNKKVKKHHSSILKEHKTSFMRKERQGVVGQPLKSS